MDISSIVSVPKFVMEGHGLVGRCTHQLMPATQKQQTTTIFRLPRSGQQMANVVCSRQHRNYGTYTHQTASLHHRLCSLPRPMPHQFHKKKSNPSTEPVVSLLPYSDGQSYFHSKAVGERKPSSLFLSSHCMQMTMTAAPSPNKAAFPRRPMTAGTRDFCVIP